MAPLPLPTGVRPAARFPAQYRGHRAGDLRERCLAAPLVKTWLSRVQCQAWTVDEASRLRLRVWWR